MLLYRLRKPAGIAIATALAFLSGYTVSETSYGLALNDYATQYAEETCNHVLGSAVAYGESINNFIHTVRVHRFDPFISSSASRPSALDIVSGYHSGTPSVNENLFADHVYSSVSAPASSSGSAWQSKTGEWVAETLEAAYDEAGYLFGLLIKCLSAAVYPAVWFLSKVKRSAKKVFAQVSSQIESCLAWIKYAFPSSSFGHTLRARLWTISCAAVLAASCPLLAEGAKGFWQRIQLILALLSCINISPFATELPDSVSRATHCAGGDQGHPVKIETLSSSVLILSTVIHPGDNLAGDGRKEKDGQVAIGPEANPKPQAPGSKSKRGAAGDRRQETTDEAPADVGGGTAVGVTGKDATETTLHTDTTGTDADATSSATSNDTTTSGVAPGITGMRACAPADREEEVDESSSSAIDDAHAVADKSETGKCQDGPTEVPVTTEIKQGNLTWPEAQPATMPLVRAQHAPDDRDNVEVDQMGKMGINGASSAAVYLDRGMEAAAGDRVHSPRGTSGPINLILLQGVHVSGNFSFGDISRNLGTQEIPTPRPSAVNPDIAAIGTQPPSTTLGSAAFGTEATGSSPKASSTSVPASPTKVNDDFKRDALQETQPQTLIQTHLSLSSDAASPSPEAAAAAAAAPENDAKAVAPEPEAKDLVPATEAQEVDEHLEFAAEDEVEWSNDEDEEVEEYLEDRCEEMEKELAAALAAEQKDGNEDGKVDGKVVGKKDGKVDDQSDTEAAPNDEALAGPKPQPKPPSGEDPTSDYASDSEVESELSEDESERETDDVGSRGSGSESGEESEGSDSEDGDEGGDEPASGASAQQSTPSVEKPKEDEKEDDVAASPQVSEDEDVEMEDASDDAEPAPAAQPAAATPAAASAAQDDEDVEMEDVDDDKSNSAPAATNSATSIGASATPAPAASNGGQAAPTTAASSVAPAVAAPAPGALAAPSAVQAAVEGGFQRKVPCTANRKTAGTLNGAPATPTATPGAPAASSARLASASSLSGSPLATTGVAPSTATRATYAAVVGTSRATNGPSAATTPAPGAAPASSARPASLSAMRPVALSGAQQAVADAAPSTARPMSYARAVSTAKTPVATATSAAPASSSGSAPAKSAATAPTSGPVKMSLKGLMGSNAPAPSPAPAPAPASSKLGAAPPAKPQAAAQSAPNKLDVKGLMNSLGAASSTAATSVPRAPAPAPAHAPAASNFAKPSQVPPASAPAPSTGPVKLNLRAAIAYRAPASSNLAGTTPSTPAPSNKPPPAAAAPAPTTPSLPTAIPLPPSNKGKGRATPPPPESESEGGDAEYETDAEEEEKWENPRLFDVLEDKGHGDPGPASAKFREDLVSGRSLASAGPQQSSSEEKSKESGAGGVGGGEDDLPDYESESGDGRTEDVDGESGDGRTEDGHGESGGGDEGEVGHSEDWDEDEERWEDHVDSEDDEDEEKFFNSAPAAKREWRSAPRAKAAKKQRLTVQLGIAAAGKDVEQSNAGSSFEALLEATLLEDVLGKAEKKVEDKVEAEDEAKAETKEEVQIEAEDKVEITAKFQAETKTDASASQQVDVRPQSPSASTSAAVYTSAWTSDAEDFNMGDEDDDEGDSAIPATAPAAAAPTAAAPVTQSWTLPPAHSAAPSAASQAAPPAFYTAAQHQPTQSVAPAAGPPVIPPPLVFAPPVPPAGPPFWSAAAPHPSASAVEQAFEQTAQPFARLFLLPAAPLTAPTPAVQLPHPPAPTTASAPPAPAPFAEPEAPPQTSEPQQPAESTQGGEGRRSRWTASQRAVFAAEAKQMQEDIEHYANYIELEDGSWAEPGYQLPSSSSTNVESGEEEGALDEEVDDVEEQCDLSSDSSLPDRPTERWAGMKRKVDDSDNELDALSPAAKLMRASYGCIPPASRYSAQHRSYPAAYRRWHNTSEAPIRPPSLPQVAPH